MMDFDIPTMMNMPSISQNVTALGEFEDLIRRKMFFRLFFINTQLIWTVLVLH